MTSPWCRPANSHVALSLCTEQGTITAFEQLFLERGLPAAIRSDHGVPFASPNALHDRDVLVTACGRICMHRKRINLSTVLAGQRVGIKELDEGIRIVSFMNYDLGTIDLEQRTLQPLDNPFGPRLSPMS